MKRLSIILLLLCGCSASGPTTASTGLNLDYAVKIAAVIARQQAPTLPDDLKTSGDAPTATEASPAGVVWVYLDDGAASRTLKRDIGRIKSPTFEIREVPQNVTGPFPILAWRSIRGAEYQNGWSGIGPFLQVYDRSHQVAGMKSAPGPVAAAAGGYPTHDVRAGFHIVGSAETREELIQHLSSDGIHAGKFPPSWLRTLSRSELLTLHDDDHQGRVQKQYIGDKHVYRSSQSQEPTPRTGLSLFLFGERPARRNRSQNCPNGKCPL